MNLNYFREGEELFKLKNIIGTSSNESKLIPNKFRVEIRRFLLFKSNVLDRPPEKNAVDTEHEVLHD